MLLNPMNRRPGHAPRRPPAAPASDVEPRWPAVLAGLGMGGLYTVMHKSLLVGPRWLLPTLIVLLLIPASVARYRGRHDINQWIGHILSATITTFMVLSLGLLVERLPGYKGDPVVLLQSAVVLWVINVLVFASWYWRLDAGGPHARDARVGHTDGAFLFPQMTLDETTRAEMGIADWSPQFVDYLFLAFNTSTALSPADTAALSRWAKVLMMIQAAVSLTIVAVIAGRAVNILPSS